MLSGVGTQSFAFVSEFDRTAARETPMTIEHCVAALTAELAQVKAKTTKLRESQSDILGGAFPYARQASLMPRSAL